jgi:DNA-3-methyladenine glycosylase
MKLTKDYFMTDDVLGIARDLLGKYLFTKVDGQLTGGVICEVEAYMGIGDRASHAYGGRRTRRNEMMYHEGGVAYVYLCYGMHHLLNFVTNVDGVPDAVLIRGIMPTHGEELMLQRTGKRKITPDIGIGPGKVSKLLGLTVADNGHSLCSDTLWIEDRGLIIPDNKVETTPRIGVDYAGEDALLPYRFVTL